MRKAISPGDTVIDIGANKGSYLLWLSRWAGSGRVVAFEPQAALADYLGQVCRALALANVTVEAKAVSNVSGERILHVPGGKGSPEASLNTRVADSEAGFSVTVPTVALDDYFAPDRRVRVIKIDVEGHEKSVFEGAERILTEQSPLLVFECENRHLGQGDVHEVFSHLERRGYRGSFVRGQRLRPISEFQVERHQRRTPGRFWDAKGYCNNFIFAKGPRP